MNHGIGASAILLAAVLWGTTGTAAAFAPMISPLAIGAAAMGIGGLLQALVNAAAIARWRRSLISTWPTVVWGAVCVTIYPLAFYTSMRLAGVALGCVVSLASAPLASAVIERVTDGRRLTMRWVIACMCGVVGTTLLCLQGGTNPGGGSGAGGTTSVGVGLGLVAGLTYAGYSKALRSAMASAIPRGAATGAILGLGGVLLMPILVVTGGATLLNSSQALIVITYLALVPMFLGYVLFSYGLGRVDATTATTITLIEPAVATLTAVVFLNEAIGTLGWTGMVLLGAALVVLMSPFPRNVATDAHSKADAAAISTRST